MSGVSLRELWQRAVAERPEPEVTFESFRDFVGEPSHDDLCAGDLLLACACAGGDPRALGIFQREELPAVVAPLKRMRLSDLAIDEIKQLLCQRLFVAEGDAEPKICTYSGRGPLKAWLRVIAGREGLALLRRSGKEMVAFDDSAWERVPDAAEDAEMAYLKRLYAEEFRKAFRRAARRLTSRERVLLRHQFVDQMTTEEIAVDFEVNRSTVSRWLAKAREKVLKETRTILREELNVNREELDSIMRIIESRLDVTMPSALLDAE